MPRALPLLVVITLLGTGPAAAAENVHLGRAMAHVRALEEARALRELDLAENEPGLSVPDLAVIQMWRGLAHAGLSHEEPCLRAFEAALRLEPGLALPRLTSPRVQTWWRRAQARVQVAAPAPPAVEAKPAEVLAPLPQRPVIREAAPPPSRRRPWRRVTGSALLVAGALGIVGSLVLASEARRLHGRAVSEPAVGAALGAQGIAERDADWATGLLAAGAPVCAGGGVLWAFELF